MGLSRDFTVIILLIICPYFYKNIEIIDSNESRVVPCNFKIIVLWLWEPEYYSGCSVCTTNWTVRGLSPISIKIFCVLQKRLGCLWGPIQRVPWCLSKVVKCEVNCTHLQLEPSLRKNVAMPLLPHMPFTASTGIGKYESDLVPEEAQKCVGL
jgi:hypothetical protein